jgi:hypothetical protein
MATDGDALKAGLALLATTFRAELDSPQVRTYQRALKGYDGDVVLAAADALIQQAAQGRTFYPLPTPPDWVGACEAVVADRRRRVVRAHLEHCDHAGHWLDEGGRVRRCPCWETAMQAGKALGAAREAVQPVALPSWHHPDEQEAR